jgi:hypothetical protein
MKPTTKPINKSDDHANDLANINSQLPRPAGIPAGFFLSPVIGTLDACLRG